MAPGVSVIICCYNSASRLSATIRHLINQKNTGFINMELIIVDNASSDNTYEFALSLLSDCHIDYQVVKEPLPGLANARLRGHRVSKYDYLLYCDDDNHLADNYVQLVYEVLQHNTNIGILGGKGEAIFEGNEPDWFKKYSASFAVGEQSNSTDDLSRVAVIYGAGSTIRRSYLEQLYASGFKSILLGRTANQITSGDDSELCYMAPYFGYEVWYHRGLQFKHLMTSGRMNWQYLKKMFAGFGRMNIYIQAYKYVQLHKSTPDENLRLPLWLDTFIHKVKYLINYYPKVMCKMNKEGDEEVLRFIAMKAEASEIWKLKQKYSELFSTIYVYLHKPESK